MSDPRLLPNGGIAAVELSELSDVDPRFSMNLVLEVRDVVEAHGFVIADGAPLFELQLALFQALYQPARKVRR